MHLPSIKWTTKSLLSKSYFNLKCNRPKLGPDFGLLPINSGPSFLRYRSGWIAPNGLAGGAAILTSGVWDRVAEINNGDKQRPKLIVRGDAGIGELQELADPPVKEARLDWDGDGVRTSSPLMADVPGEEQRISREAARRGDGERLEFRRG